MPQSSNVLVCLVQETTVEWACPFRRPVPIYGFDDTINSAQTSLVSRGVGRPLGIYSRPADMTISLVQIKIHILMFCQSAHQLDGKYTNGMKLYPISTLASLLFSHFIKTKKVTTARGLYHIPV